MPKQKTAGRVAPRKADIIARLQNDLSIAREGNARVRGDNHVLLRKLTQSRDETTQLRARLLILEDRLEKIVNVVMEDELFSVANGEVGSNVEP